MSLVRSKNTKPELLVRQIAHRLGFRFSLHRRDLPGVPDIVFPRLRRVILVHGCFWHRHVGCKRSTTPEARREYWIAKFDATVKRDAATEMQLRLDGWKVLVVWECEVRDRQMLSLRLAEFLGAKLIEG